MALRGPWLDAVAWLQQAWLPPARRLGLRYIAPVVQADTPAAVFTLTFPGPVVGNVELQLLHTVTEAEKWLRACQQHPYNHRMRRVP